MIPLKFFFLVVCLELSLEDILIQCGDATNEHTKVGLKKVQDFKEAVILSMD